MPQNRKGAIPMQQDAETFTEDQTSEATPTDEPTLGEAGQRALAEERKARRDAERAARQYRQKVEELEGATKSDVEKLIAERDRMRQELDEATRALNEIAVRDSVLTAANAAGAINATVVWKYLRDDLSIEGGEAKNLDAAMKQARKDAPHLFASVASSDAGQRGTAPARNDMNTLLRGGAA